MDTQDMEALQRWIGRTEQAEEVITPELARRFLATVDGSSERPVTPDDAAPLGIHWCVGPTALPAERLGPDGHPALGGFLPPVPFERRMWAGGELRFARPLRVGATIRRRSTVASINVKEGRSGRLCFVAVDHSYGEAGSPAAVIERQDIVYRDPAPPQAQRGSASAQETDAKRRGERSILTTPTLLFRYSAITFNGHRIHYDLAYARDVEGYPGLVVHGPLQATWMLRMAAQVRGEAPTRFSFRGIKPLICGETAHIGTEMIGDKLRLFVSDDRGETTMTAEATWQ